MRVCESRGVVDVCGGQERGGEKKENEKMGLHAEHDEFHLGE